MPSKGIFGKAAAGFLGLWLLIEEMPTVKRVLSAITGFDFIYEKANNPGWVGKAVHMALNPPPGTALFVVLVASALIYWSTKPRETRMSIPVVGMLLSVISFAAFGVWYLVRDQVEAAALAAPAPVESTSKASDASPPQWQALVRERKITELNKKLDELTAQSNERWAELTQAALTSNPESFISMKGYNWNIGRWKETAIAIQSVVREALGNGSIDFFDMSKFEAHIPTSLDKGFRERSQRGETTPEHAEFMTGEIRKLFYQKNQMETGVRDARFKLGADLVAAQQIIMTMGLSDDPKAAK
jgi:hypothetical protein